MQIQHIESGARMSQAVVANGFVFLAGQVAGDLEADISEQTRQVLETIDRLLAAAGSDRARIASVTVFLADVEDFAAMNLVWEQWIAADPKPARATIIGRLADPRYRVEMQVVAVA